MASAWLFRGLVEGLVPHATALYEAAALAGLRPRVTSVFRTRQQQAALYERFVRGLAHFPAAPPGRSAHERGLAFDMVVSDPAAVGAAWNAAGGFWSPKDYVHYEYRP